MGKESALWSTAEVTLWQRNPALQSFDVEQLTEISPLLHWSTLLQKPLSYSVLNKLLLFFNIKRSISFSVSISDKCATGNTEGPRRV